MSTSNDDYEKLDKIGEGSYGKVSLPAVCAVPHSGSFVCRLHENATRVLGHVCQATLSAELSDDCLMHLNLFPAFACCMSAGVYGEGPPHGRDSGTKKNRPGGASRVPALLPCAPAWRDRLPPRLTRTSLSPLRGRRHVAHAAASERRDVPRTPQDAVRRWNVWTEAVTGFRRTSTTTSSWASPPQRCVRSPFYRRCRNARTSFGARALPTAASLLAARTRGLCVFCRYGKGSVVLRRSRRVQRSSFEGCLWSSRDCGTVAASPHFSSVG